MQKNLLFEVVAKAAYLTAGEINDKVITQYHLPNDIHNNTKVKPAAWSLFILKIVIGKKATAGAVVLILRLIGPTVKILI